MAKKLNDHTLEKLKISERLGKVEITMAKIEGSLITMVDNHDRTLYGNNGQPGLKIHVDRINEKEKSRTWTFRAMWTAITALTAKALMNTFNQPTP